MPSRHVPDGRDAVPLRDREARAVPGERQVVCARLDRVHGLASLDIPDNCSLSMSTTAAVGWLAGLRVPRGDDRVVAGCRDQASSGCDPRRQPVAAVLPHLLAGPRVPYGGRVLPAGRQNVSAVSRRGDGRPLAAIAYGQRGPLAAGHVLDVPGHRTAMRSSPAITSVSSGENATPRTPDDIPPSRGRVTRPRCTGCCRRPRRPQSTVRSGSRPSPWRTGIQRTTLRAGGDVVDHDTSTAPRRPRSRARQG